MIVKFDAYLPDLLQDGCWAGIEQFDLRTFDIHFQQIDGPCIDQIKEVGKRKCTHLDNPNDVARWVK
jgi:hypothetical protein